MERSELVLDLLLSHGGPCLCVRLCVCLRGYVCVCVCVCVSLGVSVCLAVKKLIAITPVYLNIELILFVFNTFNTHFPKRAVMCWRLPKTNKSMICMLTTRYTVTTATAIGHDTAL